MDNQDDTAAKVAMSVYGVRTIQHVAEEIVAMSTMYTRLDKTGELSGALVRALLEINSEIPEHNKARRMFSEPTERMLAVLRGGITRVETENESTPSESP